MAETYERSSLKFDEPEPVMLDYSPEADMDALAQFQYITTSASRVEHALGDCEGCSCQHHCTPAQGATELRAACCCFTECIKGLHALKDHGRAAGLVRLLECGPACSCNASCPARPTQTGVTHQLALFWDGLKGWCVKALQPISQGSFVAEYAGEYVTGVEAERRLTIYDTEERGHALLVVRVQLPSGSSCLKVCIDATRRGNVARFINHSCDGGNLEPVIVTSRGSLLPRVALFAARDITQGEELSFCYAVSNTATSSATSEVAAAASRRHCFCGAANCPGFLPSA
ncbi:hypothetical protein OEZ85_000557 [Tetradesmus obliquus]|uniref:SET domain-containing protein n=1 Tax=Tetradesmus obliquus TaxID=3088 RepID=A0ABY8UJ57_TETOB|nr:hypothetical protein OEZ85_000557 [Tetradesmus obliquus]